jgi:uncharacterized protein DUF3300
MSAWSVRARRHCLMVLAAPIVLSAVSLPALAQGQPPEQQQAQPAPQLTQQQLQQLLAPVALYPDALLAQVLTASTYPLEVTMAARWSEKNPNLKGPALEDAMQKESWDPSVKGLASVPQVLAMMNDKLEWTTQLGEAFLAQPNDVQTAIQTLRKQAEAAGNLKSSKEQKVSRMAAPASTGYAGPPEYIVIEPVEPDYIYVPVYDPVVIYGAGYWSPAYAPFFWYPRWWTVGPIFGFATAAFVGPALWYHYKWGYGGYAAIQTNPVLYSKFNKVNVNTVQAQNWKFNPAHRGNVPFKNTNLQKQFSNVNAKGAPGIQTGKGIQTIQTGKGVQGVQGVQGGQAIQSGKNVQGLKSNKSVSVQTNKKIQVQTGNRVQGSQVKRFQGTQTTNRVQHSQTGPQGGNKNAGKGKKKNP